MEDIRQKIDQLDQKIIELLAERMSLVRQIAELKKQNQLPIQDEKREQELRNNLKTLAAKHGLDPTFINHLYSHIFIESRRIQSE